MKSKAFRESFDALEFSSDFSARTKALLQSRLPACDGKEPNMKRKTLTKKGRIILLAAALALILTATAGAAAVRFLLPQKAQDFINLDEARLTDVLAGFDVVPDDVTAVGQSVKSKGQTIAFEGIVEGKRMQYNILQVLEAMNNHEDMAEASKTWDKEYVDMKFAVLTVKADDGGPVLGIEDESELHQKLGCFLTIQGIHPVYHHYVGQFTLVDNIAYIFVPLSEAQIYADRELRICVFGNWAPDYNILGMGSDGLPFYQPDYDGLQASFVLDIDDSLADHEAVAALQEKEPLLPTEWEKAHGMDYRVSP